MQGLRHHCRDQDQRHRMPTLSLPIYTTLSLPTSRTLILTNPSATSDQRRNQLPPRLLPAPIPTLPAPHHLHLHNPQTLRMPPLRRHLRPSLHPHHQRPPLPTPPHNQQTQRGPHPSLRRRIPRRGLHKRSCTIRRHPRRKSRFQWHNGLRTD